MLVAVLVAAACDPSSRKVSSAGSVVHVPGCVDPVFAQVLDPLAEGPIAAITLTNRCDRLIRVDFDAIAARGRMIDGARPPVAPRDPVAESRSLLLRPGEAVREVIEYRLPAASEWPLELCFETSLAEVGAAGVRAPVRCLGISGPDAIVAAR